MEESGEGSPAREHVVDRLGNRGMAREFGALGAHPVFQPGDQGGALFAPRAQALLSGQSIDLALDVKECVDAFDAARLCRTEPSGDDPVREVRSASLARDDLERLGHVLAEL